MWIRIFLSGRVHASEKGPAPSRAGTMIFCLDSSDRNYLLDLSVVRINQRGKTLKLNAGLPADQFESEEVSAWRR